MIWTANKPDYWNQDVALILGHGAGAGMSSPFMKYFHQEMASRGLVSVQFDFEYMEQKRKVPDPQPKLRARYAQVIREVAAEFHPKRIIIGGKSMGGRVASYIAGDFDVVSGLVFLGYPLHPPGQPTKLRDEHLYELQRRMLFISGTKDTLAEHDRLQRVVERIGDRAKLVWIEGGDHSLKTRRKDDTSLQTAADAIDQWIRTV